MGLCDCCGETFCVTELDVFRHKLHSAKLIAEIEEIDTRFCIECVTHINGYEIKDIA